MGKKSHKLIGVIEQGQEAARKELYARSRGTGQDAKDTDPFAVAIDMALRSQVVTEEEIASEVGAPPTTIACWRVGETMPGPYARAGTLDWLKGKIEKKTKE